jgi:hypothetical protein
MDSSLNVEKIQQELSLRMPTIDELPDSFRERSVGLNHAEVRPRLAAMALGILVANIFYGYGLSE